MSEHPWWFPTAVPALVAGWAVNTLSFAIAGAADSAIWTCAQATFSVVVLVVVARRIAAAEDDFRTAVRTPSLDRWGREVTQPLSAMRLSAPVFAVAALVIALAAMFALAPVVDGVLVPAALGGILVAATFISARYGNPMEHTTRVWWPAVWYRWRTTVVLLGLFLLGELGLTTAVLAAQGELLWSDLFLPAVSLVAAWRIWPRIRDDPRAAALL